jgi:hypothetical protein
MALGPNTAGGTSAGHLVQIITDLGRILFGRAGKRIELSEAGLFRLRDPKCPD